MISRFSKSMEMSRLTRDGTAETVSRDQILRRERGQGIFFFPVQLTTCRMGNLTRLIHTLAICVTIHNVGDKATVILYTIHLSPSLFLTFSVLVANPEKLLYTVVANPAPRGLLNREICTVVCTRYAVAYSFLRVPGMHVVWSTLSAEFDMDQLGVVASPARGHLKK